MSTCNCRGYEISLREALGDLGSLSVVKNDLICPLCNSNIWHCHVNEGWRLCFTAECNNCHDYITYYEDLEFTNLEKQEYYIDEYTIIRYSDTTFILGSDNCEIAQIPSFSILNKDQLLNKVKIYLTFL